MLERHVRTVSKIEQEISWIDTRQGSGETNGGKIFKGSGSRAIVNGVALGKQDQFIKHMVEAARRLVDGGDYSPTPTGEPLDRGQDPLSRSGVQSRGGLVQQKQARVD